MNCAEVKEHLEAALDGAAEPELEKLLMLHVGKCPQCQSSWDEMQALKAMLRAGVEPLPSPALDARVMRAFERKHKAGEAATPWWKSFFSGSVSIPRPAFALLLAAFVIGLVVMLQLGRMTATRILLEPPDVNQSAAAAQPPARIVYVPVVDARDASAPKQLPAVATPEPSLRRTARTRRQKGEAETVASQRQPLESFTAVTATDTNYSTKATLAGFEPVANATVRVIKGRGE
ncbi:MAG TPA: hypothetical protein VJS44_15975 [Pyrinomonadaceae bacterium]|nr:hypothetical protein [Pyrinomonadaceae bacterium]